MAHQFIRNYYPGIGEAVADRTVNRRVFTDAEQAAAGIQLVLNPEDPHYVAWKNAAYVSNVPVSESEVVAFMGRQPELRSETWADVGHRVAEGNTGLVRDGRNGEFAEMKRHLNAGTLLMSGRHLQHGDRNQHERPMEVFTNCSTSAATFLLFYLLLNGSGVGRAYDDAMMLIDWNKAPKLVVVIDGAYPDRTKMVYDHGLKREVPMIDDGFGTPEQARTEHPNAVWFDVPDSRGGWAKALEIYERMAFEQRHDETLVLNFSPVRPNGSPIRGMQNRPSSGPGPLMKTMRSMNEVSQGGYQPWEATMRQDHYAAECVLVGGARRAARMATKIWSDPTIFGFIYFKRNTGFWSSNNSVTIDAEFRERCGKVAGLINKHNGGVSGVEQNIVEAQRLWRRGQIEDMDMHAWKVLMAIAEASYYDGTGEPGIINQDRLVANDAGIEDYVDGLFAASKDFTPDEESRGLLSALARRVLSVVYTMITNPCGEITLLMLGAYCVIADVVPFHAVDDDDAESAFRMAVRALIRTNTMDCLYKREVNRTNRIGVGMTGFHEWAYERFGFTWQDMVDEAKSLEMWLMLSRFKRAIVDEAETYSAALGVVTPHTNTTFKPAGTTSKLFGLTEGAHLPSMRWYVRWVQFRQDDPLIQTYADQGYPVRHLVQYSGTTIVGFPTAPAICELGGGEWVTTAGEATPEDQYEFLRLMEKYWITGVAEDGVTPLIESGNQISYTLKYKPEVVGFDQFLKTLMDGQFSIRCCSVMPQVDGTAYEYQPEEPITQAVYHEMMAKITAGVKEDIGFEHVDCSSGSCPVSFDETPREAA